MLFIIWVARELYVGIQAMNAVNNPQFLDSDPSSLRTYDGAVRRRGRIRAGDVPFVIGALGIVISYLLTSLGIEIAGSLFGGVGFVIAAGKVLVPAAFFIVKAVGGGMIRYDTQNILQKSEKKPPVE